MTSKRFIPSLALLTLLIINGAFLNLNAFRTFIPEDWGSFLDAGWRVTRGQIPFEDFIFTTGPMHLYLHAGFFHLLGFGKTAIFAHLVVVSSIVIIVTFVVTRRYAPLWVAAMSAALSMTCFYWPISHPWYSASAHLWGILALGILMFYLPFRKTSPVFSVAFLTGVLASLSFFTKTNIGGAYLLVFFILFLASPQRRKCLAGFFVGVFLTCATLAFFISPHQYLDQAIVHFILLREKLYLLTRLYREPLGWFIQPYGLALLILLPRARVLFQHHREWTLLFIGTTFIAIFSARTSSVDDPANAHLMGIHLGMAFILAQGIREKVTTPHLPVTHRRTMACLAIMGIGLILYTAQFGIRLATESINYGHVDAERHVIEAEPLKGWRAPKTVLGPLDPMARYIQRHVPTDESLLILTNAYVLYPLTGRDSYRGVCYTVTPGVLPHKNLVPGVKAHILQNPPEWILTDTRPRSFILWYADWEGGVGQNIVRYLGLEEMLEESYSVDQRWGDYLLLKRKS